MGSEVDSMVKDFQTESKVLIDRLTQILDTCEGNFAQANHLEEYGQTVDRIMGGAKSLVMALDQEDLRIVDIGDYAAICKAVGYKASQIKDNEQFYDICVALLQDATEVLSDLVDSLMDPNRKSLRSLVNQAFIDRLKWVSEKFGAEYRGSVDVNKGKSTKMNQNEIDELLKKLGLD